jgi:hypothetical protein
MESVEEGALIQSGSTREFSSGKRLPKLYDVTRHDRGIELDGISEQ